jgi:hypothetical protein
MPPLLAQPTCTPQRRLGYIFGGVLLRYSYFTGQQVWSPPFGFVLVSTGSAPGFHIRHPKRTKVYTSKLKE